MGEGGLNVGWDEMRWVGMGMRMAIGVRETSAATLMLKVEQSEKNDYVFHRVGVVGGRRVLI